jgi:hypothetical protein
MSPKGARNDAVDLLRSYKASSNRISQQDRCRKAQSRKPPREDGIMRNTIFVALTLICGAALPALANDTTAELATGGLIFVTNENIEMSAEDLFISAKQVRVRYRFVNKAETIAASCNVMGTRPTRIALTDETGPAVTNPTTIQCEIFMIPRT